jgi:hypothetical protein
VGRRRAAALGGGLVLALVAACSGSDESGSGSEDREPGEPASTEPASTEQPQATAPESDRVDLEQPTFSDPTSIHNPLYPISDVQSALLLGNDEGQTLRIETVLLAEPDVVTVEGDDVSTGVVQFVAYLDGRIHEVALDRYAQDDGGNVWYFGEDVFNYEDGVVADTDGTWLAGEDGPPGMIMPADPQVGQAYRPENIPDSIFEEVVVKDVGVTVDGPRGPVPGAMVGTENHLLEGHYEDKTFAPGYGEFRSGVDANLEALALAVPTDAQPGGVPAELVTLADGASDIFVSAEAGDWDATAGTLDAMTAAWAAHQAAADPPPLLAVQMSDALDVLAGDALRPAVDAHNPQGSRDAALGVEMAALDLQLQYRAPAEVDLARFGVWADQLLVDTASEEADPGRVAGDVAALEWVWDRIAPTIDRTAARDVEDQLTALHGAAEEEDLDAAAEAAPGLADTIAGLRQTG